MQDVLDAFATRLSQRLDEAQAALERRSAANDRAMREREQAHARVEGDVDPIHREIVRPMLEELARRPPPHRPGVRDAGVRGHR